MQLLEAAAFTCPALCTWDLVMHSNNTAPSMNSLQDDLIINASKCELVQFGRSMAAMWQVIAAHWSNLKINLDEMSALIWDYASMC